MSLEAKTRLACRRFVWPENPASVAMANAALRLARVVDAGDTREMALHWLKTTVAHLRSCGRAQDPLDAVRARMCTRLADMFEDTADEHDIRVHLDHTDQ